MFEYEVEKYDTAREGQMAASLTGWAQEGWRVVSVTPIGVDASGDTQVLVLLERQKPHPAGNAPALSEVEV